MKQQYEIAALKSEYDRNGVVKIPALVDRAWVSKLTSILEEYLKKDPGEGNTINFGHGPGRTTVRWMWRDVEDILNFARDPHIGRTIAGVIGATSLRFWYDNTFIQDSGFKNEELSGSPWHSDSSAFPFTGEQNPSVWVALTPVTQDTAPLNCLKGSHRTGLRYRPPVYVREDVPLPSGFVEQPDWEAAVTAGEWEPIWFTMEPGDTLIVHPDTVHGAPPAADGAPRRIGFSSRWAGDDVRWHIHDFALSIPGINYDDIRNGTQPSGEFFPEVWREEP